MGFIFSSPKIGILMLDTDFTRIPGDVGNPESFEYPVMMKSVTGASPKKIVETQDPSFLTPFIEAGNDLVEQGARAITTSCGFLAMFQRELTAALPVPVFTSSLLQVPLAYQLIQPQQKVGILTANRHTLGTIHFQATGIENIPIFVQGMEAYPSFYRVFVKQEIALDTQAVSDDMESAAKTMMEQCPEIGAVVMECTNMPPYAGRVKQILPVPVFDIITMTDWVAAGFTMRNFEIE